MPGTTPKGEGRKGDLYFELAPFGVNSNEGGKVILDSGKKEKIAGRSTSQKRTVLER